MDQKVAIVNGLALHALNSVSMHFSPVHMPSYVRSSSRAILPAPRAALVAKLWAEFKDLFDIMDKKDILEENSLFPPPFPQPFPHPPPLH